VETFDLNLTFFVDKGLWLEKRHKELMDEIKKRGLKLPDNKIKFEQTFEELRGYGLYNDWRPKEVDIE